MLLMISCGSDSGGPNPEITNVQPESGPPGASVTISGKGFRPNGDMSITFGGSSARLISAAEDQIQTEVPESLSEGAAAVEVSVEGVSASGPSFMVEAKAPGISSVEPDSGTVGTEVRINGMNFSAVASEVAILFDGTSAEVKEAAEDKLITEVPQGATDGPIEVTVKQKSTTGPEFDVITEGTIKITTSTTGSDKDSDGFTVSVDGSSGKSIGINSEILFSDTQQGSHNVELSDMAENCRLNNSNPRSLEVTAGDTVSTTFEIDCQAKEKSKIAVTKFQGRGNYDIFLMNPDGSNQRQITEHPASELKPVISNNGDKIAFSSDRNGDHDLYVMNTDGSNVQRLTQLSNLYVINATWSPDDSKIAFDAVGPNGYRNIYSINADGTDMKLLTDDEANDKLPSWSPNGSKIAFNSERFDASKEDYADGEDIFTVNADGGGIQFVTENDATNTHARWSPDGTQLVFVSNNNSGNEVEIYVMNADGGSPQRLTNNSYYADSHPSWSPDGAKIVFEGENGLYAISSGGGTAQKISDSDDYETPFWSLIK
jgi:Tol biopolymer transport system component